MPRFKSYHETEFHLSPQKFSLKGFGLRLAAALVLVFASYNPFGLSYFHWLTPLNEFDPVKAFAGLLLIIGWVIFIRATVRSLGSVGIVLVSALFGTLFWMIIDWGVVSTNNIKVVTVIIQVILCLILAIGMSWSHVRRRLSGQVDADDVDD